MLATSKFGRTRITDIAGMAVKNMKGFVKHVLREKVEEERAEKWLNF